MPGPSESTVYIKIIVNLFQSIFPIRKYHCFFLALFLYSYNFHKYNIEKKNWQLYLEINIKIDNGALLIYN